MTRNFVLFVFVMMVVGLMLAAVGCTTAPSVERSFRECLLMGKNPGYVIAGETQKVTCE